MDLRDPRASSTRGPTTPTRQVTWQPRPSSCPAIGAIHRPRPRIGERRAIALDGAIRDDEPLGDGRAFATHAAVMNQRRRARHACANLAPAVNGSHRSPPASSRGTVPRSPLGHGGHLGLRRGPLPRVTTRLGTHTPRHRQARFKRRQSRATPLRDRAPCVSSEPKPGRADGRRQPSFRYVQCLTVGRAIPWRRTGRRYERAEPRSGPGPFDDLFPHGCFCLRGGVVR
jgi:hypothetical protein